MPVIHVFLCSYKPEVSTETINERVQALVDLKEKCVSPTTGKPYIVRASGGEDDTGGARAKGLTHVFVFEFANDEDRKYYIESDPAHEVYRQTTRPFFQDFLVMDYTF